MNIVFDMDNTLTDEMGSSVRPGISQLLQKLVKDGHDLFLFTNSKKERAKAILYEHNLKNYFKKFIFREDYDPGNTGKNKDIRVINGDLLIDDDPEEIKHMKKINKKGFLVTSYRKGTNPSTDEMAKLYDFINKKKSIFGDLFK
jgi:hydroxymethylpyrimidine pyrophosphatase-like HAD family hydrolase